MVGTKPMRELLGSYRAIGDAEADRLLSAPAERARGVAWFLAAFLRWLPDCLISHGGERKRPHCGAVQSGKQAG